MHGLNRNTIWAEALVAELAHSGVRHACVSPGSRSAPLALALAEHGAIQDHSILDERCAAFFALGLARAAREPVALLCTSGTAAAGYLPALIEAHYSGVPLLVLSADRPPEERDCGAAQTIEQLGLYGPYVRLAVELPPPELTPALLHHVRRLACRAVATARAPRPGPVQLNVPFREPLAPASRAKDQESAADLDALARGGRGAAPMTRTLEAEPARPNEADLATLAEILAGEPRGWLVTGPLDAEPELSDGLMQLADALRWPLLADPLSQLRSGGHDRSWIIDAYDAVLRAGELTPARKPRTVLRFGAMPTSKAYRELLERNPEIRQIVVDPWSWRDPTALATEIVRADPLALIRGLLNALNPHRDVSVDAFADHWLRAGHRARQVLDAELGADAELSEPSVAERIARPLPEGGTLFVASGMPVRDLDLFWAGSGQRVRVLANRGANGIDGTLSSALGCARAAGPTVLLIGDLALLHDCSALLIACQNDVDLTVVVLDNRGGGIFEFLPIANAVDRAVFERHLATPQAVEIPALLRGFGLPCRTVTRPAELDDALEQSVGRAGVEFVHVRSNRPRNVELHRKLIEAVRRAVRSGVA
ncbi:MAG: 2-succinyl-5-enolpyruvyl-6-hydroxy-3-cyclohexene-1-carboxylic-acid synthase [Myxococcota bacterium]